MGASGTGYANSGDSFRTRVLNIPADDDIVTIFGSGNDEGGGVHPSEAGHKLIAPRFKAFLESILM